MACHMATNECFSKKYCDANFLWTGHNFKNTMILMNALQNQRRHNTTNALDNKLCDATTYTKQVTQQQKQYDLGSKANT